MNTGKNNCEVTAVTSQSGYKSGRALPFPIQAFLLQHVVVVPRKATWLVLVLASPGYSFPS
jgi:hypothetical protein